MHIFATTVTCCTEKGRFLGQKGTAPADGAGGSRGAFSVLFLVFVAKQRREMQIFATRVTKRSEKATFPHRKRVAGQWRQRPHARSPARPHWPLTGCMSSLLGVICVYRRETAATNAHFRDDSNPPHRESEISPVTAAPGSIRRSAATSAGTLTDAVVDARGRLAETAAAKSGTSIGADEPGVGCRARNGPMARELRRA
jgi:hypothetical protein